MEDNRKFQFKDINPMKKYSLQSVAMPIGMISLVIAIILTRYFKTTDLLDFISGFLFGLSIVLNLYYIYKVAANKRKSIPRDL